MQESKSFYRLIYTSHAVPPVDTSSILLQAQANNRELGVTGGLALLDGTFMQYLEGSAASVKSIFSGIARDPRHVDVQVLEERSVPGRMFEDWSMALLKWTEQTKQIFWSFSPGLQLDLYQTDPATAAPLFRAWAATKDWRPLAA